MTLEMIKNVDSKTLRNCLVGLLLPTTISMIATIVFSINKWYLAPTVVLALGLTQLDKIVFACKNKEEGTEEN